jgi:hypothetical protein
LRTFFVVVRGDFARWWRYNDHRVRTACMIALV